MPNIEMSNASLAYGSRARAGGTPVPQTLLRRAVRSTVHFLSYHFIMKRRWTSVARSAGFDLVVPPTVFNPGYFMTGAYFAEYIASLDLRGLRVADIGTGSGILALAAARAGASNVAALDINPNAAWAASENARRNGYGDRVMGICSDLLAALPAKPLFDVIVSNPPYFPGEPLDLADRAWHSGPDNRDIADLFKQARERLVPGGRMYVLFSSNSDLDLLGAMIEEAKFRAHLVGERSIFIESFVLYELQAV